MSVCLSTSDPAAIEILSARFRRFLTAPAEPAFRFDIIVIDPPLSDADADLEVRQSEGRWVMRRGDFRAEWDVAAGRGRIWQPLSPYGADTVLRIVHTLILATQGGFLLHASSVIRNGRAFLFTGPSGAGKSTIVGLAPDDVAVLTDEIWYVRRKGDQYLAFGTPFAGERSDLGQPGCAPVAALFQLGRGADNEHVPLAASAAVKVLLRNILFFADDLRLTGCILDTACDFVARVPAFDLRFAPDPRVWSTIR